MHTCAALGAAPERVLGLHLQPQSLFTSTPLPCPNVSSRSWNVVSVRSTGQANTAPLKGEQIFADLAWLLCEIQISYEYLVSTIT